MTTIMSILRSFILDETAYSIVFVSDSLSLAAFSSASKSLEPQRIIVI